jgi:ribosomal protein S27AE
MPFRYDTYCGLNCGACPILGANERGDEEWIKKAAESEPCKPEDLRCQGCKTDVTAIFCTDCEIRLCAREKGVEFCHECTDFPCETISNFRNDRHPHHSVIFKNLRTIKGKGLEVWLAKEKKRWSCKKCGARFYWYSEKCSECGAELYNAIKEERNLDV